MYPKKYTIIVDKKEMSFNTVWGDKIKCCQTCRKHINRPSRCTHNNIYVGRKDTACKHYNKIKGE